MKDISSVDSNLKVQSHIDKKDVRFFDAREAPFRIHGVFYEEGKFRRLPETVAKAVNSGVHFLHANTAGGRVRFKTDSPYIAIHAKMPFITKIATFALTGSAGFDLYVSEEGERFAGTFVPPFDMEDGYESVIDFDSSNLREITINFPLYSEVSELYIGVSDKATLDPPQPYTTEKPIVYYGSSITQGGCASRPGLAYESMIARRLDADYVNLGFSGSAQAEDAIADYIKKLDMTAFVYDYDHNAPSVEHLQKTHEKMFKIIREANHQLPIILLSRPKYRLTDEEKARLDSIRSTYDHAKKNGDEQVYLIDGHSLMKSAKEEGTVDGCHPNDFGFACMAQAVGDLLEKILRQTQL